MRVALTGAHGVGKSTLADELAAALAVPVLPTPGRTLAAKGLAINESATVTSQTLAWLLQFRFERECEEWVAPRTLIDVWAYTLQAADRIEPTEIERPLLEELRYATPLAIAERYDELIYLPPRIALQDDGVRPTDAIFQIATDEAIAKALSEWKIAHTILDVTDRDAVDRVLARLTARAAR